MAEMELLSSLCPSQLPPSDMELALPLSFLGQLCEAGVNTVAFHGGRNRGPQWLVTLQKPPWQLLEE